MPRSFALCTTVAVLLAVLLVGAPETARAFCGFYVAKADASLYNESSQVALVRDGERTVLTMSNDYKGELKEFALVVPVPAVLKKEQIHVTERKHIEHLDAYSAPRLVEYFDPDPCARMEMMEDAAAAPMAMAYGGAPQQRARSLGVTIEAAYTVGEYDIVILSATESSGLETWLRENGYRIPERASQALAPYIKQGLKFFVAKVNLGEQAKTGRTYLRPLQMAYESKHFMLPIRLGMVNASGPQDLLIYVLTRNGRVETQNYRTVKVPSDVNVPVYVKEKFGDFYRAAFETAWKKEGRNVAFLEYFWDMASCDPCAADPLPPDELRELGVFWLGGGAGDASVPPGAQPTNTLLTRLHVRYDSETFPEDLVFQETRDRNSFQGRYILQHPFTGEMRCPEARAYVDQVRERREQEAQALARLTGWAMGDIRKGMGALPVIAPAPSATPTPSPAEWWRGIWKK